MCLEHRIGKQGLIANCLAPILPVPWHMSSSDFLFVRLNLFSIHDSNFAPFEQLLMLFYATIDTVTPLQARTFAIWTLTSSIVRFYAAYHITDKTCVPPWLTPPFVVLIA